MGGTGLSRRAPTDEARANPLSNCLDGRVVLIVFCGPHSYISPDWYSRSTQFPTWIYTSVHAYARAKLPWTLAQALEAQLPTLIRGFKLTVALSSKSVATFAHSSVASRHRRVRLAFTARWAFTGFHVVPGDGVTDSGVSFHREYDGPGGDRLLLARRLDGTDVTSRAKQSDS